MNGNATGIHGSHTCRGYNDHALGQALFQALQKGGFAGTGLACQKNMPVGMFYKIESQLKLFVGVLLHKS